MRYISGIVISINRMIIVNYLLGIVWSTYLFLSGQLHLCSYLSWIGVVQQGFIRKKPSVNISRSSYKLLYQCNTNSLGMVRDESFTNRLEGGAWWIFSRQQSFSLT